MYLDEGNLEVGSLLDGLGEYSAETIEQNNSLTSID